MVDELSPKEEAEFQEFLAWRASQKAKAPGWSPLKSAMHFGAGAVEETAGLAGLLGDALYHGVTSGPKQLYNTIRGVPWHEQNLRPSSDISEAVTESARAVLPEKDPDYRYARSGGGFFGPGAIVNKATKAPVAMGALWDVLSGLGAQFGGDVSDESPIGRMVGAMAPAAGRAVLESSMDAIGRSFTKSPERDKQTAAAAFKELSQLDEQQIAKALANRPNDDLGRLMTTAELTDNPMVASIAQEKPLEEGLVTLRRMDELQEARRNAVMGEFAAKVPNRAQLGSELIENATDKSDRLKKAAEMAYKKVSRRAPIYIEDIRAELSDLLDQQMGGSPPSSAFQRIARQIAEPMEGVAADKTKAGRLMDIRSELLQTPAEVLTPMEQRVRGMLISKITDRLDLELKNSAAWKTGRSLTARRQSTFERGTPGGSLVNPATQPENAFGASWQGTREGARKLRAAIGDDPELLQRYKAALLDSIPVDSRGEYTVTKFKDWLQKNEGGARELLGKRHFKALQRVQQSLQSEARGKMIANLTSKGLSSTAARNSAAATIAATIGGAMVPGGGLIRTALGAVRGQLTDESKKAVQAWMIRAALDPEIAMELVKSPTSARIRSLSELMKADLGVLAKHTGRAGAMSLAIGKEKERQE